MMGRVRLVLVLAGAAVLALGLGGAASIAQGTSQGRGVPSTQAPPDLILFNGKVATVDTDDSFAQAVAVRDGTIVAVGGNGPIRAMARPGTQLVDVKGRTVLPGLVDGHLHGLRNGYHCWTHQVRLDLTFERDAALAAYTAQGAELPADTWIVTRGGSWNVAQLDAPGMFTRDELDEALPAHPALVEAFGFDGARVNSRALELLELGSGDPGVEVDPDTGEPSGRLTGDALRTAANAVGAQFQALGIDQQVECLRGFVAEMNRVGVTAWDDAGGGDFFDPDGPLIPALRDHHGFQAVNELHRTGELTARVGLHLISYGEAGTGAPVENVMADTRHALSRVGDDLLWLAGIGEEVFSPSDRPPPPDEYLEITTHLARNRWAFKHHASVDATQQAYMDTWEQVDATHPIADLRWTIDHPGRDAVSPSVETLDRLRNLGGGVVVTNDGALGKGFFPPYRRVLDSGARWCMGTDALDIAVYPPFANLWYAVSGDSYDPDVAGVPAEQRLTRMEALRGITANCAWFLFQEERLGSIEAGNHADVIVLSDDYFTVPVDDIRHITSVLTIVGGRIVHADAEFAGLAR